MTAKMTGVRTQQEVADVMGISRARVMQLEQSAMTKIRKAFGLTQGARRDAQMMFRAMRRFR